jgi:hypothetical protein
MALYAQFYVSREPGKIVSGLGDRSVIQLDARERSESHHELARDWISRHQSSQHFVAYRLFAGRILNPHYTTPVLRPDGTEVPVSEVQDY